MPQLNLNDGLFMKRSEQTGDYVCMYRDRPGEYYMYSTGRKVDDETAKSAGFDVVGDRKNKLRLELHEQAKAKAEAEFAEAIKAIDNEIAETTQREAERQAEEFGEDFQVVSAKRFGNNGKTNAQGQLRETPRYAMEHIGGGLWRVIDKETKKVVEGGERVSSDAAVALMLRLHNGG